MKNPVSISYHVRAQKALPAAEVAALAAAERFLRDETQFHLGMLPTEQPHPATRNLSETLQRDPAAGIRLLQTVDRDVVTAAARVFASAEYRQLVSALYVALQNGRRVCFSGCGATGRLSILLEACWRRCWRTLAQRRLIPEREGLGRADQVCSIMTGGDYALIRSIEHFEDFTAFGRRQVQEADLGADDVLVAISEGGETSSVIGTVHEAVARGARTFFAFNNPAQVLTRHIERSREAIERPAVTILDLSSGPMAVAGSTRMQATTTELLVVGAALNSVLTRMLTEQRSRAALAALPKAWRVAPEAFGDFAGLLDDLAGDRTVAALSEWVEIERNLYAARGRITYFAGEALLDIFTDTTERAPTFMLPPFRKCDDPLSPPSWAFVKDPLRPTPEAWQQMLARAPRCLEWNRTLYEALGAPPATCASPPRIGSDDIIKFCIGNDADPSRSNAARSIAMAVLLSQESRASGFSAWNVAFAQAAQPFAERLAVLIGDPAHSPVANVDRQLQVPCRIPSTPLGLWERLATKLVLNTVSTATMGCLGRLVGNWMSFVEATNKKLVDRGSRLVAELASIDYATACRELHLTLELLKHTTQMRQEGRSPVAETVQRLRNGTVG